MLLDTGAVARFDLDLDTPDDPVPAPLPGPRLRKIGGQISNQLSANFAALEARFHAECSVCIGCGIAAREDGRLRCGPCAEIDTKLARRQMKVARAEMLKAPSRSNRLALFAA